MRSHEIAKKLRERFGSLQDDAGELSDEQMVSFVASLYPLEYEVAALRVDVDELRAKMDDPRKWVGGLK